MAIHAEVEGVGTLEFPDGTDPSVIQATVKKQISAKAEPKSTSPKEPPATWSGAAKGVADAALAVGSGIAQQVVGVPKHLAALAGQITEPLSRMTPELKAKEKAIDAQPGITEKLQGLLSYTPKTEEGKYLLKQIQDTLQPVSEVAGQVKEGVGKAVGKPATDVMSDVIGLAGLKGAGGASTGAKALAAAASTESKVQRIIGNLSGGRSLEKADVGKSVQGAAGSTVATAKKVGEAAYDELTQAMGPGTPITLEASTKAAAHHGAGLVVDPKVAAVSKKLQSVGSMTFDSMKQLRSQIDDLMGSDRNVNRQLRDIRNAMTKDIDKAAEKLSPEAKKAWDTANAKWKAYKQTEDKINRVMGKNWEGKTPAEMYQKLLRVARSDPQKIKTVMESIKDPAVKRQFSASVLHHMSDRGGEFDGDKLVRQWETMDPQARKELFAPVGANYEANMTKLVQNLRRIKEGHTGLVKEVSGLGVAALLGHFIPGLNLAVGAVTLAREGYKFGPNALEAYLTSPQKVRTLAERTTAFLEHSAGTAVVGTQQANSIGNLPAKPPEPARVGDVQ